MKRNVKIVSLILSLTLIIGVFAGCGKKSDDGKTHITVASWPIQETQEAKYEMYEGYKAKFLEQNPDVVMETDEWQFDLKSYLVKAAGKDLPTVFSAVPTELATLANSGYIKDITPYLEKYGYLDKYNEDYSRLYTIDGKAYALVDPSSVYKMGMVYSNKLFKEAGLVDEKGLPIYPQTWDEVTETAIKIKEATGKPGYVLATNGRHGGWHFLNIAWGFGTTFMEQDANGKWKASFNSPECAAALQWVKDMKWKHDVLQDNLLTNLVEIRKLVGTDEGAMGISASDHMLAARKNYGTDPKGISMSRMPAGPAARASQLSGNIWCFNADATDEEIEAVFKWFDMIGMGTEVNEDTKAAWEADYKAKAVDQIVGIPITSIWKDEELYNERSNIMMKYSNVNQENFVDYTSNEGIEYRFEPEKCVQELYDVLDAAIQKVLTDKNADVNAVLEEAAHNFQVNFLDKVE